MIERKMLKFQEIYIPIMQMKQHIVTFVCRVLCVTHLQLFRKPTTKNQSTAHTRQKQEDEYMH